MQIDTAGTYTLKYTAEDACGNVTEVTREVIAEVPPTYRTVLYTDGTFIINESSRDQATNEALHGTARNIYDPMEEDGSNYVFTVFSTIPWYNQRTLVTNAFVGSEIKPQSLSAWFYGMANCLTIDLSNIDGTNVTSMRNTFNGCRKATSINVSTLDTHNVTDMTNTFFSCEALTDVDVSGFDTNNVTTMESMFHDCYALPSIDVTNFDTSNVTTMYAMFYRCKALETLDLSNFDTSAVTNTEQMFCDDLNLTTIYASSAFVVTQVTSSTAMFSNCTSLVGGAGTTYDSYQHNKTYARIDNPPSAP